MRFHHTLSTNGVLALLLLVGTGCRVAPVANSVTPAATLDGRVGWVNGSCLAIMNTAVQDDTPITIVAVDDTSAIRAGRVRGATTSSEVCPPLLEDRRRGNARWSFYEIRADGQVNLGIAITGDLQRAKGGIDLTGDGTPEQFTQCATSEGISFRIWSATPYRGTPLWSGYYYLGYDTEANCPS